MHSLGHDVVERGVNYLHELSRNINLIVIQCFDFSIVERALKIYQASARIGQTVKIQDALITAIYRYYCEVKGYDLCYVLTEDVHFEMLEKVGGPIVLKPQRCIYLQDRQD